MIGGNLRRRRGSRTLDEMAALAREGGLPYQRETYRAVENGEKTLDLAEVVLLSLAFGMPSIADLLGGAGKVNLSERAGMRLDVLRSLLGAGPMPEDATLRVTAEREPLAKRAETAALGEVELKAARRLSLILERPIDALKVSEAAYGLWGRSLTEEREARLGATAGLSPRTIQGRRGRITRTLLEELEPTLKEA